jgi:hypothetical protein
MQNYFKRTEGGATNPTQALHKLVEGETVQSSQARHKFQSSPIQKGRLIQPNKNNARNR